MRAALKFRLRGKFSWKGLHRKRGVQAMQAHRMANRAQSLASKRPATTVFVDGMRLWLKVYLCGSYKLCVANEAAMPLLNHDPCL